MQTEVAHSNATLSPGPLSHWGGDEKEPFLLCPNMTKGPGDEVEWDGVSYERLLAKKEVHDTTPVRVSEAVKEKQHMISRSKVTIHSILLAIKWRLENLVSS